MNRDEAMQIIKAFTRDPLGPDYKVMSLLQANRVAISDMETVELMGKVMGKRSRFSCLTDFQSGAVSGYLLAIKLLTDPDALRAEAKRLGIEEES